MGKILMVKLGVNRQKTLSSTKKIDRIWRRNVPKGRRSGEKNPHITLKWPSSEVDQNVLRSEDVEKVQGSEGFQTMKKDPRDKSTCWYLDGDSKVGITIDICHWVA